MLAISLPDENEDEPYLDPGETEDLCASHGFEYVEGATHSVPGSSSCSRGPGSDSNVMTNDIGEGIHRIVEALHTIMWPSMQQQPLGSPKRKARPKPNILSKLSLGDPESLENIDWTRFSTDEFHAEKIALERWLDSDDPGPIITPTKPSASTILPNSSSSNGEPHDAAGFDDDFSDFVSAPASAPATTGTTSESPSSEVGSETGWNQVGDDPEDDLFSDDFFPTDQEIFMTSHRIFGPHLPSQRASSSRSARADGEGRSHEDEDEGEGNTLGDGDFDFSRIMGALQGLKEEISGIENEEVKRKMAARVAMGLVYGLEGMK
jgi:hypothetical protein